MSSPYSEIVRDWPDHLRANFPEDYFHHTAETGSTNDDLLALAARGKARPGEVTLTDYQSKGRGRRGDRWEAEPGRNLLFSIALPLAGNRTHWSRLPHLTAMIVGRAVESILPDTGTEAKWPNDIYIHGKKLAGILVETVMQPAPFAIVGIGLNVNTRPEEFPNSIADIATSLYSELDCESSRWFVLGLILKGFFETYPDALDDFDEVKAWLESRSYLQGKMLALRTAAGHLSGTAHGLGPDGELLIKTEDGRVETIISAEEIFLL
ncbi:MAG: biotin--[acetyl-CoA-carboxylase] ligase [Verrucomicrobiales bacterium]